VAKWAYEIAQKRGDAEYELVDIKDFNLPLLDEPLPPVLGKYAHDHTKAWSAKIAAFDAYVFVTRIQPCDIRSAQECDRLSLW
jgi:NAD(P)H-dependent FMN reductase